MKLQFITSLLLLLAITTFDHKALAQGAKDEFTEENEAIPPSFGNENTVLVCVLRGRKSYDKYLMKGAENYTGKKVFITREELESEKYADTAIYRFVFDYSDGTTKTTTTTYSTGSDLSSTTTMKRFYVEDRAENKIYQSGAEYTNFGKAIAAYMENLEAKRKSKK